MTAKLAVLPHAAAANREQNTASGPHIAIVDDEESVCVAIARLIRAYSFQARTYGSGTEFLASLRNAVPACLIVDVHLGDMNGFEILRRLAGMGMNIPAIALTARDEPAARRDSARCGATALLIKPVRAESLLNAITAAMSTLDGRGTEGWGL